MELWTSFTNLVLFFSYLAAGLIMLAGFALLFLRLTPYDDLKDIHDGKIAPAIALAGAMLGFTFPLLMASYVQTNLIGYIAWSAIACVVQLGVFWAMYRYLPKVIETNNVAGSLCFAVAAVCAGLLNAASFVP
jgi:putative membrane protein